MCAIAGILNLPAPAETVRNMKQTMRRRGPDDFGIIQDGAVTLLHARLTIYILQCFNAVADDCIGNFLIMHISTLSREPLAGGESGTYPDA